MSDWSLKGTVLVSCNCDYGCPCNFNALPTQGKCEGGWTWHAEEGNWDGLSLAGLDFSLYVNWPGAIHEGNGKLAAFVDAESDEQREAIGKILMGEDGGMPWEILATTVSELHGPFFETIEIEDRGTDSSVRVGDKVHVQMETFTNPVTGEPHEVHTVLPTGFIFTDGHVCTTSVNRVDADGIGFDHAGNNAYYAHVEWSSAAQPEHTSPTRFA